MSCFSLRGTYKCDLLFWIERFNDLIVTSRILFITYTILIMVFSINETPFVASTNSVIDRQSVTKVVDATFRELTVFPQCLEFTNLKNVYLQLPGNVWIKN